MIITFHVCTSFRNDTIDILGSLQYNDSMDVYEREPFSVLIGSTKLGNCQSMDLPMFNTCLVNHVPLKLLVSISHIS